MELGSSGSVGLVQVSGVHPSTSGLMLVKYPNIWSNALFSNINTTTCSILEVFSPKVWGIWIRNAKSIAVITAETRDKGAMYHGRPKVFDLIFFFARMLTPIDITSQINLQRHFMSPRVMFAPLLFALIPVALCADKTLTQELCVDCSKTELCDKSAQSITYDGENKDTDF